MLADLMIVVITMNLKEDSMECIHSLVKAGSSPDQIIIVDNGSTDDSVPAFRLLYGGALHILANPENVGFAQASNQGFQYAVDKGAEWVLLLNNDTIVAEDFFIEIEEALASDQTYKILAPVIYYHSDPEIIWHMGSRLLPGTMIWNNQKEGKKLPKNLPLLIEVDSICGCAMLIHQEVYEKLGLFDPKLIIYWEEVEFCWRAHQASYRMAVIPKAKMWHKVSKTMDREKPRARYLRTRNQVHFYKKYAHGYKRPSMLLFAMFKTVGNLIHDIASLQTELIQPMIEGWRDGLRDW